MLRNCENIFKEHSEKSIPKKVVTRSKQKRHSSVNSGAPNENIVQNHLNIELTKVFWYLNGRYRHILSPKNFSSVPIS